MMSVCACVLCIIHTYTCVFIYVTRFIVRTCHRPIFTTTCRTRVPLARAPNDVRTHTHTRTHVVRVFSFRRVPRDRYGLKQSLNRVYDPVIIRARGTAPPPPLYYTVTGIGCCYIKTPRPLSHLRRVRVHVSRKTGQGRELRRRHRTRKPSVVKTRVHRRRGVFRSTLFPRFPSPNPFPCCRHASSSSCHRPAVRTSTAFEIQRVNFAIINNLKTFTPIHRSYAFQFSRDIFPTPYVRVLCN